MGQTTTQETQANGGVAECFAAINPYVERLIETAEEKKYGGAKFVNWGSRNTYPYYIKGLTHEVPTLRTVILGLVDYICGNDIAMNFSLLGREEGTVDRKGTPIREFINQTAMSAASFGGWAWKVTQNLDGSLGELECLPMEHVRADADSNLFYYGEKFKEGRRTAVCYPRWIRGTKEPETVLYVKLWGDGVYPEPIFAASVKACETERSVDDYHLGNIERGFMGSYLVNFNDGKIPTDQEKKEVEKSFTQKFAGHRNAGRIMFSWNRSVQNRTTLEKMEVSDYGDKYETLSKHCRQQIFTSFRANPNLFGIPTESNGFNAEEYEQSFRLFNRTMVFPIQQRIIDALDRVLDIKGSITIEPFSIDGNKAQEVVQ